MGRDANAERLAIALRELGTPAVRHDEEPGAAGAGDQPFGARAERRNVDEEIAARAVEHDVLPLVLEGLVQLEDPRSQLLNVHGSGRRIVPGGSAQRASSGSTNRSPTNRPAPYAATLARTLSG